MAPSSKSRTQAYGGNEGPAGISRLITLRRCGELEMRRQLFCWDRYTSPKPHRRGGKPEPSRPD
eukprot:scaffold8431_cov248-Pinguiococcus_pyrenoidosus.AAC.11